MLKRWWWVPLILVVFFPAPSFAQAIRSGAHITTQTTTTLVSAVAGKQVQLNMAVICVDSAGAAAGVAIQDTGGTNILGTGVVFVIGAGQCLPSFGVRPQGGFYGIPSAVGTGLQVVTSTGNGPVNIYFEATQR